MFKCRILLTGVGGQGTLTATTLLAKIALDNGLKVTAGEIHGMAQRGGVVESYVLIGGYKSPKISQGEADILLGFEPLETLRSMPSASKEGMVISNTGIHPPISVVTGKAAYPDMDKLQADIKSCVQSAYFIDCHSLAAQAGNALAANTVLLGALFASGKLPFGSEALETGIKNYLKPKLVDMNIVAARLGADAIA